ncbi:MAG: response regulator [Bdellovibrionota bacterium]
MSTSETPVIFYIDDEPHNLVVFEAACPDDWKVHVFENPMVALQKLDQIRPHVIISDQRMPGMTGVQFLEVAKKILPDAVRIIVTGYSDEDLVVESVRKAQIFDYIKKPWEVDDLLASLTRALDFQRADVATRRLQAELVAREAQLRETNGLLTSAMRDLELAQLKEADIRKELECWVPPFLRWALDDSRIGGSQKRDLVGIAFDIVNSSALRDVTLNGRHLRSQIIQIFTEAVLRHGGWRESHSGDSAYGHFGLLGNEIESETPADSALASAREFRVALRNLSSVFGKTAECGIALHIAVDAEVHIHTVQLNTPRGPVTQKSFDTSSTDVDLLHRMEKLVHQLPGTNIVMSRGFVDALKVQPPNLVEIGYHLFAGQKEAVPLLIIPSDLAKPADLDVVKGSADSNVLTFSPARRAA